MSYSIPGAGGVSSVNGKTGAVALVPSDLGAAPLASPALTGTPTAPTPATGDASTLIATTAHVAAKIAANAPGLAPVQSVAGRTGAVTLSGADVALAAGTNGLTAASLDAAVRQLDGLVMPSVTGYLINTPPASPADGDCQIVGAAGTGAYAGQSGKMSRWSSALNAYEFYTPKNGWMLEANSARESYRYTGGAWEVFYQEGTWTPSLTGASIVGSPIFTGAFIKHGRFAYISALIQPVAGSTVASSGGNTTYYSNSPFTPSKDSSAHTVDSNGVVLGSGWTHASIPYINVPAFAADGNWISTSTSVYI